MDYSILKNNKKMCSTSKIPSSDSENDKTDSSDIKMDDLTTNLNIKQETKIKLNFSVDRLLSMDSKDKTKSTEQLNSFQSVQSHPFMYMNNGLVCCKLNSSIPQKSEHLRHLGSCSSLPVNFGNIFIPTPRYAQSGNIWIRIFGQRFYEVLTSPGSIFTMHCQLTLLSLLHSQSFC